MAGFLKSVIYQPKGVPMKILMAVCLAGVFLTPNLTWAGEFTPAVHITSVRPYRGVEERPWVFLGVDQMTLPCNIKNYAIEVFNAAGKEIYAAALLAFAQNRQVEIEIWDTPGPGCDGWPYRIQSIKVLAP